LLTDPQKEAEIERLYQFYIENVPYAITHLPMLYGFAPNTHLNIGTDPSIGGRSDKDDTRFNPGNVSVGVFHNFNREYNNTPAFAVRADAYLPIGRDSRGVEFRVRGIASKIVSAGVGLRQQVGYQSVVDIGLKGNLATGNGERSEVRLVTGYSFSS
jgi:hypothetical protein